MRVYHMTEEPYPDAWNVEAESLRVNLPNRHLDPVKAADLYHRFLDEWQLCDELGINIFVNEHHSTATCMTVSCNIVLGILAKTTKRVRILGLGIPIANRPDPLRVAEECAMIDVISRGRFDMGFIKGVPYEIVPSNSHPTSMVERFWEAHDLIIKAMTTHDGPFSGERKFPLPFGQYLAAAMATAASADLGQRQQPRQRAAGRRARLCARHGDDGLQGQRPVR